MEFSIRFNLDKDELLEKYGEEYIYDFYRENKEAFNFNSSNLCEFHKEKSPSMRFYKRGGSLFFKCFGCGTGGDVFEFVKLKTGKTDFQELIDQINSDLNGTPFVKKKSTHIEYSSSIEIITIYRKWADFDIKYWSRFYIELKDCEYYNIFPVQEVYIRNELGLKHLFTNYKNNPIYCIEIDDKKKIYRPLSEKRGKWLQNCNRNNVLGYNQLPKKGDIVIITSSLKDSIVLNKLGYPSVSAISETTLVPEFIINDLKSRFNEIIVFLDNDNAGRNFSEVYNKLYGFRYFFTESNEKDISDYIEINGLKNTIKLLNKNIYGKD